MARFTKRFIPLLWAFVLCIGMLGVTAYAAGDPVSATIQVNTAVSGDSPEKPETFTVEMTADQAGAPMPEGTQDGVYTMQLRGAASGKLRLDFDRLGVYRYTVRQLPVDGGDCTLDPGVYHITAYVTLDDQGALQLSVVLTRDGVTDKQEKIEFSNRYPSAAQVTPCATTTLDKKAPENGQFTYVLKDQKGNVLQTVKNTGKDVQFQPIPFDKAGTYTYTMAQVVGEDPDISYDRNQYTVVVKVTKDENGDYQAQVTYKLGDKVLEGEPAFVNKTKAPTPQTGDKTRPGLLLMMLLISGSALVGLWDYEKRRTLR